MIDKLWKHSEELSLAAVLGLTMLSAIAGNLAEENLIDFTAFRILYVGLWALVITDISFGGRN